MTDILFAVSPSMFSWSMLGRGSSAAFLLPRPKKGIVWPTLCWTHPAQVAVIALILTGLVDILWHMSYSEGHVKAPVILLCSGLHPGTQQYCNWHPKNSQSIPEPLSWFVQICRKVSSKPLLINTVSRADLIPTLVDSDNVIDKSTEQFGSKMSAIGSKI